MDLYYIASLERVFGNNNKYYRTILINTIKKVEGK